MRRLQPITITLAGRRYELSPREAREMLMYLSYVETPNEEIDVGGGASFTPSDDVGLCWRGEMIEMSVAEAREARDLLQLALRGGPPS